MRYNVDLSALRIRIRKNRLQKYKIYCKFAQENSSFSH